MSSYSVMQRGNYFASLQGSVLTRAEGPFFWMEFSDGYFVRVPVTENSDSLDKLSMKSVSPGWCGLLVFESV